MTTTDHNDSNSLISPEEEGQMAKYGITRVRVDHFHYGEYSYTNLKDAIAQAERQQPQSEATPVSGSVGVDELAKYGITRAPVDCFHYKEYSYTNLKDAIAQAEHQHHSG